MIHLPPGPSANNIILLAVFEKKLRLILAPDPASGYKIQKMQVSLYIMFTPFCNDIGKSS
jgi:hypothetical protein